MFLLALVDRSYVPAHQRPRDASASVPIRITGRGARAPGRLPGRRAAAVRADHGARGAGRSGSRTGTWSVGPGDRAHLAGTCTAAATSASPATRRGLGTRAEFVDVEALEGFVDAWVPREGSQPRSPAPDLTPDNRRARERRGSCEAKLVDAVAKAADYAEALRVLRPFAGARRRRLHARPRVHGGQHDAVVQGWGRCRRARDLAGARGDPGRGDDPSRLCHCRALRLGQSERRTLRLAALPAFIAARLARALARLRS